ncbi:RPL7D [Symbiodinium natans]|uniref:RPL7D protein n=1 Tax=Symbiodinium natans TaxID=878477 RepID=A0A812UM94_9DINO|nr:RPL7D [Symbiodinium natans]
MNKPQATGSARAFIIFIMPFAIRLSVCLADLCLPWQAKVGLWKHAPIDRQDDAACTSCAQVARWHWQLPDAEVPEGAAVPELVKLRQARDEKLAAEKKQALEEKQKQRQEERAKLKERTEAYEKEYADTASELVKLRREAKLNGNFFVEPEAKLLFVVRIAGIIKMSPKPRKVLQLLRLKQLHNGVFLKVNKPILNMLKLVQPYVTYGYPSLKTVRELVYKRGFGKVNKQRLPLASNDIISDNLGKYGIHGMEDIIHEIYTVGPSFKQASNFLWPFKLSSPKGGFINKRSDLTDAMLQQTLLCTVVGMLAEVTAFAKHGEAEVPEGAAVPELVKLRQARDEKLAAEKKQALEEKQKQRQEERAKLKERTEAYEKEYADTASELVKLRREAKLNGNFFVEPEAKLLFVVRIAGIIKMSPKPRKVLQLLRLKQLHNGVFLKVNKPILNMLKLVQPYVTYGYPSLKTVRELVYKRGFGKVNKQRLPLASNDIISDNLGKYGIHGMEDIIHEIYTVGPSFKQASNFLWPFKLSSPKGGFINKRHGFCEARGGDWGNREELINDLLKRMN